MLLALVYIPLGTEVQRFVKTYVGSNFDLDPRVIEMDEVGDRPLIRTRIAACYA